MLKMSAKCCLWHTFPPKKPDGSYSELHPFQAEVIKELETSKRISVLKCRNAGMSQIALMYALYLTLCKQTAGNYLFVTGVGYILSRSLARRVRAMLATKDVFIDDNSLTITFPHCRWSFYPSDSRSYRGQSDVVFVCADELTSFDDSSDWRASLDTFAIKNSGAFMFLITTPSYKHDTLAYKLFNSPDQQTLYKNIFIPYTKCLNTMLDPIQINLMKQTSPSFESEYNLQWSGYGSGNAFDSDKIDACFVNPDYREETLKHIALSVGVDPAYSSDGSKFAISVVAVINDKVWITDALEFSGLEGNDSVNKLFNLLTTRYNYFPGKRNVRIMIDSHNSHYIRSCKRWIREDESYEVQQEYARKNHIEIEQLMTIVPVSFAESGVNMLQSLQMFIADDMLRIPNKFYDLKQQLHIAKVRVNGNLDKSKDSLDLVDSTRLALLGIQRN
jgi:hypothetical protein